MARSTALVLIALVVALGWARAFATTSPPGLPGPAPACATSESRILVDARSALVSIDPATLARTAIPVNEPRRVVPLNASGLVLVEDAAGRWFAVSAVSGAVISPIPSLGVSAILLGQESIAPPPRWMLSRSIAATGTDVTYSVFDRVARAVVLERSSRTRIELAAVATSPDGRWFVHVQSNNIASDVFIFDAATRKQWSVEIFHDASLAAYSISLTFNPNASCIAISMEREGRPDPETWIVDLTATIPTAERVDFGFVLAWIATARG